MKHRMQQPACENLMSGSQQKLNVGLASTGGINPSDFRRMRGFLYCHLTQSRHRERMHPLHAAHGSPWHRKAKNPNLLWWQKVLALKNSNTVMERNSNTVMEKQRHNLRTPFQRQSCSGEAQRVRKQEDLQRAGVQSSRSCNTTSDIWSLIHRERRALGAEAGTSPMLEENWNMEKWWQIHPSSLDF